MSSHVLMRKKTQSLRTRKDVILIGEAASVKTNTNKIAIYNKKKDTHTRPFR